jgi:serine/threonine protein kinase/tetratricopeptide (TPR) repeat protein
MRRVGAETYEREDPELAPGTQLPNGSASRFRILRRLGAGGMGVVYEALDLDRNVRVALKTLRATNAQSLYRFKVEFRALAEIVHPRLVPLFELMADGERWFFTMELLDDGVDLLSYLRYSGNPQADPTLARNLTHSTDASVGPNEVTQLDASRTRRTQLELEAPAAGAPAVVPDLVLPPNAAVALDYTRVRNVFRQLAEGVQVLHERGRLHRDLKPENVSVRRSTGDVVLLDFGLVAALEDAPRSTSDSVRPLQTKATSDSGVTRVVRASQRPQAYPATEAGTITGTVAYMAPEQAMALPLTAASDWYSMGVMLYEALAGQLPFQGTITAMLTARQLRDPLPVSHVAPETPADLAALCMALLRRDPATRISGPEIVAQLGGRPSERPSAEPPATVFVGRSHQLQALWQAFERSAEATQVVHVRGASGAGKSALLNQFAAELNERPDTQVLTGRCYEQEFIPFKAVDSLMDSLTRHLMQWPPEDLTKLTTPDAKLLARLFPVLGRVFTQADEAAEAGDLQSIRQRAFVAVRELLRELSKRMRLVLFIDDLQWGDVDSCALIAEVLRTPDAPRLLLVLAYRNEHVASNACLRAIGQAASAACAPDCEQTLEVGSLDAADAHELARELLEQHAAKHTLERMLQQAAGSAFLIHELAQHVRAGGSLHDAQQLELDDILWQRVLALPPESRALLTVVAVAGRPIKLQHAQQAAGTATLAPRALWGLRAERLVRTDGVGSAMQIETFHDRVRESIVARTPFAETARHAAELARVLLAGNAADAESLAVLFESAGELGRASEFYTKAVPQAVAALAFERAEVLARKAIALARSDAELAAAYEAAIHYYTDMARFGDAYEMTRRGVGALGIAIPAKFVPPLFARDFVAAQLRMMGRKPADLLELPTMPEGRLQLAVRLANAGAKAAYQVRPELCVALCTKIVRLCLIHGNSPDCAIGYMVFGAIFQGGILKRYAVGHELGQLALALIDKYRNERQRAEVSFVVGYFGMSWLRPATEAEALWRKAFAAGQSSGDLFHMGCAAAGRIMSLHMRGVPLDVIEREASELVPLLAKHGQHDTPKLIAAVRQAARDLRGATHTPGSWADDDYDEPSEAAGWQRFGARHFAHYCQLARAHSHYLWGRLDEAEEVLREARRLLPESQGTLHSAEHVFVEALVASSSARSDARSKLRARLSLSRSAAKLKGWAARCPENFAAKAELVRAEAQRVGGTKDLAIASYERAAKLAEHYSQPHVAALAHLLLGRYHAANGGGALRDEHLARARERFRDWGATALADRT